MADIVYLIRHAAPPEGGGGRFWGRADPGVDPGSLARAESLASLMLEKPTRLYASPLDRAALTAERLNRPLGVVVEYLDDLAEADFGCFDGLTYAEISSRYPEMAREWAERGDNFSFPDGESIAGFFARAERVWQATVNRPEKTLAVVAHGGIISTWICLFLGFPMARRFDYPPDYCALTAFMKKKNGVDWEMAFFNK